VGIRFRTIGWIALGLLVATGLGNLWLHPYFLRLPRFHWKLGLVALALVLAVVHDFVLGPRAGKPGADPSVRVRASWVARINVLVVLVIVFLGLGLLR
jgi:putative copper export protein